MDGEVKRKNEADSMMAFVQVGLICLLVVAARVDASAQRHASIKEAGGQGDRRGNN